MMVRYGVNPSFRKDSHFNNIETTKLFRMT